MKSEIIKDIEETIKYNKAARSGDDIIELYKDATRKSNDVLARAKKYINNNNEYSRGLDDAWRAVRKIFGNGEESLTGGTLSYLFGNADSLDDIVNKYEAHDAISILDEYEKEQEDKNKLKLGDVVEVYYTKSFGQCMQSGVGVFLWDNGTEYWVQMKQHDCPQRLSKNIGYTVKKTGEHVDILGALGKENK